MLRVLVFAVLLVSLAPRLQPVSIEQAFGLAEPVAREWHPEAQLYWVNSVDLTERLEADMGLDGRRVKWNVEFVIPGTNRHFTILVHDGRVVAGREFRNPTAWKPYEELPDLPMDRVMATVRRLRLEPGSGMAFGYHFTLHRRENRPTLEVFGQVGASGERRAITFDPDTGDLLSE